MKLSLSVILILAAVAPCFAQYATVLPKDLFDRLEAESPHSLPRNMTPAEQQMPLPQPTIEDYILRAPPTGAVYCPAEYEQNEGILLAWEDHTGLLTSMTVAITTQDPDATVYMVVDSVSEQSTVTSTLTSAGADMSQVQFIVRTTDSVWIRDYGPRFIFEDGNRAIVDHIYNRPQRPNDNLFNGYLSTLWGEPRYEIPLTHGGGNFHLFSNGDAFMSDLILAENPAYTEQEIKDLFAEYQNVNLTIYPGFPTSFDSTRHIDMWMMPAGDDKVIIGQYSPSDGSPYTITENAASDMASRGYTVFRTPGWQSGGTHYTYTNAVVMNDLVFISYFGSPYTSQDAQALAVFQAAFPDHTIYQLDCSGIIPLAGALHCIAMHVPAYAPNPQPPTAADGSDTTGVYTPVMVTLQATDDGLPAPPAALTFIITDLPADGVLVDPGAGDITFVPYTLTGGGNAVQYVPNPCQRGADSFQFKANDGGTAPEGGDSNIATCTIDVLAAPAIKQLIYSFPLDTDPGWTMEGLWQYGPATYGGSHNRDPAAAYSGTNIFGYNLGGDYANGMATASYLTTGPLDCTGLAGVELRFRRWLGVESTDSATIEASNDGASWTPAWQNSASVADIAWSLETADLSAVADGQAAVYVRWGMGPTDGSISYPGWNIDDVEVYASVPAASDFDDNGNVDGFDFQMMGDCFTGPDGIPPAGCECVDADTDGDIDLADFAILQAEFTGA